MSRVLKTKFPCRHCGAPAEVGSRRDAPFAICRACSDQREAVRRVRWQDESAERAWTAVNGKTEDAAALAAGWLRAASKRLEAAALCLEAGKVHPRREARTLTLWARARVKWAESVLAQLGPFLQEATDTAAGVELLKGLGQVGAGPRATPALRLVRDEDVEG